MAKMELKYRGYDIEVEREKCLGGWPMTYFHVFRIEDGLEVICDFSSGSDPLHYWMDVMKEKVDEFIKTKGESENMVDDF